MSSPTEDERATALASGRAHIDDIDARIIALVQERITTSAELQRIRMAAGEPRIAHTRELQIVERYASALGKPGGSLALTVLELCRGRTS